MLFKLAALSMIAATTHIQQTAPDRAQWIYKSGPNAGFVCGVLQQNGSAYQVYLPAVSTVTVQTILGYPIMAKLPWMDFANLKDAMAAVNTYCPVDKAS